MDILERVKAILAGEEDLERGIGTNEGDTGDEEERR